MAFKIFHCAMLKSNFLNSEEPHVTGQYFILEGMADITT